MTDAEAYRYLERAGEQYPALLKELGQKASLCQLALNAIKAAVAAEKEACACDQTMAVAAEREACAKVAEEVHHQLAADPFLNDHAKASSGAYSVAAAIRARS